jgi:deoxyribonuclease-4
MLIGAHVSASGGVDKSISRAEDLGVEYIQTFLSSPQTYKVKDYTKEDIDKYLNKKKNSKVKKVFAHAIYLINFASTKQDSVQKAKHDFNGVVVHVGSSPDNIENGIKRVSENLKEILDNTDPNSIILLENSAGAGKLVGAEFWHLVEILNNLKNDKRVNVCIDTQHMFASGYDLKGDPTKVLDEIVKTYGDKLHLIHLNDSKTELGSNKDRHENIGEGLIGYDSLKTFCTDTRLKNTPIVMEVPGFDGEGPDKKNVEIVKSFLE